MTKKFGTLAGSLAVLLALSLAAPAAAHHKASHDKGNAAKSARDNDGDADSRTDTTRTEDNDGDGVANNVVDAGDNRHPSGKDRSVETGGSATQGKSESDPDGDTNGGVDKPGGDGGRDAADQDGNNGCGNDDDFEDDNNGNCLRKGQTESEVIGDVIPEENVVDTDSQDTVVVEDVLGETIELPEAEVVSEAPEADVLAEQIAAPSDEVLGARVRRSDAPQPAGVLAAREESGSTLPFTGANILTLIAVALLAAVSGFAMTRVRRS